MRPIRLNILLLATSLLLTAAVTSCGSAGTSMRARGTSHMPPKRTESPATFSIPAGVDAPTRKLLTEARSWLGTSYKYGGDDASGVDCSGFVMSVFERSLSIKLPRNSAKQQEYCRDIDRKDLAEGDLVFFTTRGSHGVGHVGIYIGDGRMIHSSSSRGVIISSLNQQYYLDNYYSSGRVERFYAMKTSRTDADQPVQRAPHEAILADRPPTPQKSSGDGQRAVHFRAATLPPATAASMAADREKALNALLTQIEDSIYTSK